AQSSAEEAFIGTARYASPEQAERLAVDHRSDIYAVGLVLYTLLSGHEPFDDLERHSELLEAHAAVPLARPSLKTQKHIPIELERVVMKAVAKKPGDRFASAREFAAALDDARIALTGESAPDENARGTARVSSPSWFGHLARGESEELRRGSSE